MSGIRTICAHPRRTGIDADLLARRKHGLRFPSHSVFPGSRPSAAPAGASPGREFTWRHEIIRRFWCAARQVAMAQSRKLVRTRALTVPVPAGGQAHAIREANPVPGPALFVLPFFVLG
jgi:hypothetical protein